MSKKITILHNNRCRNSRGALAILKENFDENEIDVVDYINFPLNAKEIKLLLKKLNLKPQDIIRKKESLYKENYSDKSLNNNEWVDVLVNNPKLIERPIIQYKDKAIIARPPEVLIDFI